MEGSSLCPKIGSGLFLLLRFNLIIFTISMNSWFLFYPMRETVGESSRGLERTWVFKSLPGGKGASASTSHGLHSDGAAAAGPGCGRAGGLGVWPGVFPYVGSGTRRRGLSETQQLAPSPSLPKRGSGLGPDGIAADLLCDLLTT